MEDGEWCYNTSNKDAGLTKSGLSPFTFLPLAFCLYDFFGQESCILQHWPLDTMKLFFDVTKSFGKTDF